MFKSISIFSMIICISFLSACQSSDKPNELTYNPDLVQINNFKGSIFSSNWFDE